MHIQTSIHHVEKIEIHRRFFGDFWTQSIIATTKDGIQHETTLFIYGKSPVAYEYLADDFSPKPLDSPATVCDNPPSPPARENGVEDFPILPITTD